MKEKLTIGKIAILSGVNTETVRFYEKKELIRKPKKQGAFRYYDQQVITKITFIKRSQELGFSLKEIKSILDLKLDKNSRCKDVLDKTNEKIQEIEQKIKDLKKMKKSLLDLANCCESEDIALSECPIFECFIHKGKLPKDK